MKGYQAGLTLLEVLITVLIIAVTAIIYLQLERNAWSGTITTGRINKAGQMIEKQIEAIRISVNANPATFWPPVDGSTSDGPITLSWYVDTALGKTGTQLTKVRKLRVAARWTNPRTDSVVVYTYVAKDF